MKNFIPIVLLFLTFFGCQEELRLDLIEYPGSGIYGVNLLDSTLTVYQHSAVSFSAILGEEASLRVKVVGASWRFTSSSMTQWTTGGFNDADNSRIFTSIATGSLDGKFEIYPRTTLDILVYENGSDGPSWSKSVTVE